MDNKRHCQVFVAAHLSFIFQNHLWLLPPVGNNLYITLPPDHPFVFFMMWRTHTSYIYMPLPSAPGKIHIQDAHEDICCFMVVVVVVVVNVNVFNHKSICPSMKFFEVGCVGKALFICQRIRFNIFLLKWNYCCKFDIKINSIPWKIFFTLAARDDKKFNQQEKWGND